MKVFIDIVINHTAWDSVLIESTRTGTRTIGREDRAAESRLGRCADLDWSQPRCAST
jgi:hypothetical protein